MFDTKQILMMDSPEDFVAVLNDLAHRERGCPFAAYALVYELGLSHGWTQRIHSHNGRDAADVDWTGFSFDEPNLPAVRANNRRFEALIRAGFSEHSLWLSLAAATREYCSKHFAN